MAIAKSILDLIGNTPLLELRKISAKFGGRIFAKLEMFNPMSSVKDRIALNMINRAEEKNLIIPGKTIIVEPTSGNTGIGLAMVALVKGYRTIMVLPDSVSLERQSILKALGAHVIATPADEGFDGVIKKVEEIVGNVPDTWAPLQFNNMANPEAHLATGREIWDALSGQVDAFVTGIGTGGTISGVAKVLKSRNPAIKIFAVEPETCALLSGGEPDRHTIQGLNAGFIAQTTNLDLIDEAIVIKDEQAFEAARFLTKTEGVFAGISSGASLVGAMHVAARDDYAGKCIVTLFPDTGERYLSTPLWDSLSAPTETAVAQLTEGEYLGI